VYCVFDRSVKYNSSIASFQPPVAAWQLRFEHRGDPEYPRGIHDIVEPPASAELSGEDPRLHR